MVKRRCLLSMITIPNLTIILITISSVATESNKFRDVPETPEILKTINEFIEERARQRFFEHWQRLHIHKNLLQGTEITGHTFSYHAPLTYHQNQNKPINFAVAPSDPRFYYSSADSVFTYSEDDARAEQENSQINPNIVLPPSPQDIKPKLPISSIQKSSNYERDNKEQTSEHNDLQHRMTGVIQKPVEMNGAITVYIIAIIGGISAAVTVGLISIIIGWYTLFKKAKAAADVEYPAYGVTGPNKESSPTVDQKLEQSAEIYHFQHQKQQIIAMERHCNAEAKTKQFDAEMEEENEDGDYTVYECPGLAPTAEMEINNPLFHDDSTLPQNKNED